MKLKSILMKSYIKIFERKARFNDISIKYLLYKNRKSKRLIVVFSGWPLRRISTYNYVRTLKNCKYNKLFILDSGGYKSQGTYYLGNGCKWLEFDIINKLINKIKNECGNIEEVVFAGTSKGATCAILYGLRLNVDHIICGSPQFRIAWYLKNSGEYQLNTLPYLIENSIYDEQDIDYLLDDAIDNSEDTTIHMIYSSGEYLYPYDLYYLVDKLNNSNLKCHLYDLKDNGFTDHSDVGTYFKPFLLETLDSI